MHPRTRQLFDELPASNSWLDRFHNWLYRKDSKLLTHRYKSTSMRRIAFLKNQYAGSTAYILTCGPSLSEVWNPELHAFLKDKLVISVKQAHELDPTLGDFHLFNSVRIQPYSYPSTTFRLSVWEYMRKHPAHIHFPLREDHNWEKAIIRTNDYDHWGNLEAQYERPLGTGIMFEVGLFLPVHLGCKRIVIIGFDMNSQGKYHFYRADNGDSTHYARKGECEYAQTSIPYFLDWAKRQGVSVEAYSPLSALPIPQINKERLFADAGLNA